MQEDSSREGGRIHTTAIVLAAGRGKRMNSETAKQYLLLDDRPILYYSLKAFQDSRIDDIVLVVGSGEEEYVRLEIVEKYGFHKVRRIVQGGRERYISVQMGLLAIQELAENRKESEEYVFIQDGARPFLTEAIIERTFACVVKDKACVAGMPVKDTIKIGDQDQYICTTPARERVWMIQTPQVFEYGLVRSSYEKLMEEEASLEEKGIHITDDAGVVELFGGKRVKLVQGSYENIKITTPEDLLVAEAFCRMGKIKETEKTGNKGEKK